MIKFLIFFKPPLDEQVFEDFFAQRYVPAMDLMPHVVKSAVARPYAAPRGAPAYYLIHEIYFDTREDLVAALNSQEGKAAGALLMQFAKDLVTMMFAEIWE